MAEPDGTDIHREDYAATYCPEDDKIRLYTGRVERSTYEWLRSMGFTSTPKQDCDFVAVWSPAREDAALLLIGEGDDIGDEDQSPEDRAADRAERFSFYRDKRRAEAGGLADRYDAGPDAYGNQNAARAERAAARRDITGARACTQWSKAEYWQHRTGAVIRHALHKSSAAVRRSRILRLEAEQRKHLADITEAQKAFDAWAKVQALDDPDAALTFDDEGRALTPTSPALRLACHLANTCGGWYDRKHPRTGRESSIYSHLFNPADPITAREAAALFLGERTRPEPGRLAEHYALRLAYERQMLDAEGGSAGNVDMQPGGMLGRYLITKVNRSSATGAVVSVNVHVPKTGNEEYDHRRRGSTLLLNVQRMGEHVYSAPTEESLGALAEFRREEKARTKKANAAKPKLVNPTPEDAERLQAALNESECQRRARYDNRPASVQYMTQAEYTKRSAGTYSSAETCFLRVGPMRDPFRRGLYSSHTDERPVVCKVRAMSSASVVCITDKPQKALPDWSGRDQEVEA